MEIIGRFKIQLLASAVLIGLAAFIACAPTPELAPTLTPVPSPTPLPATPTVETQAALTIDALKNGAYQLPDLGPIQLGDGAYEEKYGEGATQVNQAGFMMATLGDLNGDSSDDAAVVLWMSGGGSGSFIYLAAVLNEAGAPTQAGIVMLGDRVQVQELSIAGGIVSTELVTHGPNDPLCCPSQRVTQTYGLQAGELIQLSSTVHFPEVEITGIRWYWAEFLDTAGLGDITVPDPENYWLELSAEGQYTLLADCNQGGGAYTLEGSSLKLEPGPMTLMACPPGSLDSIFLERLGYVATFVLQGDDLYLNLRADGGDMRFSRRTGASTEPAAVVELADGARCFFAGKGATLAFDGKRLNYTCETTGDDQVGLLGDLQLADGVWTAERVVLGHDSSGFFIKESEVVTVRIVDESSQRPVDDPTGVAKCPPAGGTVPPGRPSQPDYDCDDINGGESG